MRFCNKQCEKEAHTKEKSTKKEPENPSGETEDLLKKEVEAEMKREEKIKRRIIKTRGNTDIVKDLSSGTYSNFEKYKTLQERYLNEV
jgi:hypothetical protein